MTTFKMTAETFLNCLTNPDLHDLEDSLFELFTRLDIDNVTGETLRRIAQTVGSKYINLDNVPMTRAFIKGTIAAKTSRGTIRDIDRFWKSITASQNSYVEEFYPASINLVTDVYFNAYDAARIKELALKAIPAHIDLISNVFYDSNTCIYNKDNYDSKYYAEILA